MRFTGVRDDVDEILRTSDALVLPSALGTETFPNVVLEAMASGVPVLTTDVGSVAELISDGTNGVVVPPNQTDALEAGLRKILASPELRNEFSAASRKIVEEKFTIEGMCRKREQLFSDLLCNRRAK